MGIYAKCVGAYLTGWLIVQPIYNRLLSAWRRQHLDNPSAQDRAYWKRQAEAIVAELHVPEVQTEMARDLQSHRAAIERLELEHDSLPGEGVGGEWPPVEIIPGLENQSARFYIEELEQRVADLAAENDARASAISAHVMLAERYVEEVRELTARIDSVAAALSTVFTAKPPSEPTVGEKMLDKRDRDREEVYRDTEIREHQTGASIHFDLVCQECGMPPGPHRGTCPHSMAMGGTPPPDTTTTGRRETPLEELERDELARLRPVVEAAREAAKPSPNGAAWIKLRSALADVDAHEREERDAYDQAVADERPEG